MNTKNRLWLFFIFLSVILLGCKEEKKSVIVSKEYTVNTIKKAEELYFSGHLKPIRETAVSAPDEAVVKEMLFRFGTIVHKGDVIVKLDSPDQQKKYDDTLTEYLKAKDALEVAKAKFSGTEQLWQAGLVPKNSFQSDQSALLTNKISFLQARVKLVQMVRKLKNFSTEEVLGLSLSNFDQVKKILNEDKNFIYLKAPHTGIALIAEANSSSNKKQVRVGSQLKATEVITLVGDVSGMAITIKIPEINIDKIKAGMKAKVTGIAFPALELDAEVDSVNAQANSTNGASGGLPIFTAQVVVPKLTQEQSKLLRIGMSASVKVILKEKNMMMIPIAAVSLKSNKPMVKIKQPDGTIKEAEVQTGVSTAEQVQVLSGLKDGQVLTWSEKSAPQ